MVSMWWQATWLLANLRKAGGSSTHSAVACGQREAKTQPVGGSMGDGGSPRTGAAALG